MKAALLVRPGEIRLEEIPEPTVGPGEVAIGVGGVGLCGSDLSVFSGKWSVPEYPWVMGHEAFGTIEAVGAGVDAGRIGQAVVVEPNVACFACDQCGRGRTSACTARQSVGMNRAGALAERLVVPARFAWPISGPPEDLVCVEPTTVVMAALRRLGSPPPPAALVIGVGAQGLLMSLALMERGVEVHAFDVNPDRVAHATSLGARSARAEETAPWFELVVDTVGSPSSVELAMGRLAVGGTLLFIGLDDRPLDISAQTLVRRQLVLRGSLTYDHPGDFAATVELIRAGRFRPGRVVSSQYELDDAQQAFDQIGSVPGKSWIRIGSDSRDSS